MTNKLTKEALDLARELVRLDSCNPPGGEAACAELLGRRLEAAGFRIELHPLAPGRPNLVARLAGEEGPALCLSGHMDTVPLGEAPWSFDPLGGEIADGRLLGRGACDMKSGLAALTAAAVELARLPQRRGDLLLVFSAGEETGCEGARQLAAEPGLLGRADAVLVGEPTGLRPCLGHKGALWFEALTRGKAAHASMPHAGDNAIYKAARAICALESFDFGVAAHPHLGSPTLNVGTIQGGTKVNMVPDRAHFSIDARVLPGQGSKQVQERLAQHLGPEVELALLPASAEAVWTPAEHPWVGEVCQVLGEVLGQAVEPGGLSYFTDASALGRALGGPPVVILGPGEPEMAHQTDESCPVEQIEKAAEAYLALGRRWLQS